MSILIADSGSTKTDWWQSPSLSFQTQGLNPFHQSCEEITRILTSDVLPVLSSPNDIETVFFYGSGVRAEVREVLLQPLSQLFPKACVSVESDLLGAARALCGDEAGIPCILGTGSNSALYDGQHLLANTPPLGYILGDEGSGAYLGATFVNRLFKGSLPESLRDVFLVESQLSLPDIIHRVYREPLANRFLASLSPFIAKHLDMIEIEQMVVDAFRLFIDRNIRPYSSSNLAVHAVGSVAHFYERQWQKALELEGMKRGRVLRCPMAGLIAYHQR